MLKNTLIGLSYLNRTILLSIIWINEVCRILGLVIIGSKEYAKGYSIIRPRIWSKYFLHFQSMKLLVYMLTSLSDNRITDVGASAIAQALHQNTSLQYLRYATSVPIGVSIYMYAYDSILTIGYAVLCPQQLSLRNNPITDRGWSSIVEALRYNKTLSKLRFVYIFTYTNYYKFY